MKLSYSSLEAMVSMHLGAGMAGRLAQACASVLEDRGGVEPLAVLDLCEAAAVLALALMPDTALETAPQGLGLRMVQLTQYGDDGSEGRTVFLDPARAHASPLLAGWIGRDAPDGLSKAMLAVIDMGFSSRTAPNLVEWQFIEDGGVGGVVCWLVVGAHNDIRAMVHYGPELPSTGSRTVRTVGLGPLCRIAGGAYDLSTPSDSPAVVQAQAYLAEQELEAMEAASAAADCAPVVH